MRNIILILALVVLLVLAGAVLAYPIDGDGNAYPMPETATIESYPIVWPTITPELTATNTPQPTPKPEKPKPMATVTPIIDGLPYIDEQPE